MFKKDLIYQWNGYRFENNNLSIGIVPNPGGRIMSLKYKGQEMFFNQNEYQGQTCDLLNVKDIYQEKKQMGFRVWGGDKTWIAPEKQWIHKTPPLDLDSGNYQTKISTNTIFLQSPLCRETGVSIERSIDTQSDNKIILKQTITNNTNSSICKSIWNVTQWLRPSKIYLPMNVCNLTAIKDEGLTESAEHKVQAANKQVIISCDDATHFKYSANLNRGEVLTTMPCGSGLLAHKRVFSIDAMSTYAHNAQVEIYNSKKYNYYELEIHAPLTQIKPSQSITHKQEWYFHYFTDKNVTFNEIHKVFNIN